jgi:cysteine-rich repeat protein
MTTHSRVTPPPRRTSRRLLAAFALLSLVHNACSGETAPSPQGEFSLSVAPLSLPRAHGATWDLHLETSNGLGAWTTVFTRSNTENGNGGSMTFIGACPAGPNRLTVKLVSVRDADNNLIPVVIPPPAVREFTCLENQDVLLEFDITVMAEADQGFFDIAINYEDVFCSAKVDCQPALSFHPETGQRTATLVTGLTCSAGQGGDGENVYIALRDAFMCCSSGTRVACTALQQTVRPGVLGTQVYEGEAIALGGLYLNTTWTIDTEFLTETDGECFFTAMGFVNTAPIGEPISTVYEPGRPAFHYYAHVLSDGTCPESPVDVGYTDDPPNGPADCSPLPDVGPYVNETCNGRDDDCDGDVDDGFIVCLEPPQPGCNCTPPDFDDDGIPDAVDNCPYQYNPTQLDSDGDAFGDACDGDIDGDGVPNPVDNCRAVANSNQLDANSNGVGDACETMVSICGDGFIDIGEQCDNGVANSDLLPNACRTNCLYGFCGDNIIDVGEQCDDGNDITGDGCEPDCKTGPLQGDPDFPISTTFGNPDDPTGGWEGPGFEPEPQTPSIPNDHLCVHGGPLDDIYETLTSPVYETSAWPNFVGISITGAVLPTPTSGANPATAGGAGYPAGAGAETGFGGATSTVGVTYGSNESSPVGSGGISSSSGEGSGGSGSGGSGGGGGSGSSSGSATDWGYPGEGIFTDIEYSTDGGLTWTRAARFEGYWAGTRVFNLPVNPSGWSDVIQCRVVCHGRAGPLGHYFGIRNFSFVANAAPVLSSAPDEVVMAAGESRIFNLSVTDADNAPGPKSLVLLGGPSWATLSSSGAGSGTFALNPPANTLAGFYQAALGYSDGALQPAHWVQIYLTPPTTPSVASIKIRAAPNNPPTEFDTITLTEGQSTTLYAAGYDASGNYLGEVDVYWVHNGTLPEGTTTSAFAVYQYTGQIAGTSGSITARHPSPSVATDSTGTITVVAPPPGPPSLTRSLVTASPSGILTNGGTTTLRLEVLDSQGRPVTAAQTVVFETTAGTLVGSPTTTGGGIYTQTLNAPPAEGLATITARINGGSVVDNAIVTIIASTASTPTTIDCTNKANYENRTLIVAPLSGQTSFTIDTDGCGPLVLDQLIVRSGATLTHPVTPAPAGADLKIKRLDLRVKGLHVEAGGKIDVNGKGFPATRTYGNATTGGATNLNMGGSHAGLGGRTNNLGAITYGLFDAPFEPGGGGNNAGATGGGVVKIVVTDPNGSARIDGEILANGIVASTGGAGGSIFISAPLISGTGLMTARGGTTNAAGGAGGGGRIAIIADLAQGDFAYPAVTSNALAFGGDSTDSAGDGGAGTLYYSTDAIPDLLHIDGNNLTPSLSSTAFVVLPSGSYTSLDTDSLEPGTLPTAQNRFIGSEIELAEASSPAGVSDPGPSIAFAPVAEVTGYGSILLSRDLTSRDPLTARKAATISGTYRGVTRVNYLNVVNNAKVKANGNLYVRYGSLLDATTFQLDGVLEAEKLDLGVTRYANIADQGDLRVSTTLISRNVANYALDYNLEGGVVTAYAGQKLGSIEAVSGGRLSGTGGVISGPANFFNPASAPPISTFTFESDLTVSSGTWTSTGTMTVGGALSLYGVNFMADTVSVGADFLADTGTSLTLTGNGTGLNAAGDIILRGTNTSATHSSIGGAATNRLLKMSATNIRVLSPATINVDGKGHAGGWSPSATYNAAANEGASHGGLGYVSALANRNPVYGSLSNPIHCGAGGGSGGAGGGSVLLEATEAISVSTISANGVTNLTGGAGGSVNLRAGQSISATSITARGGNAQNSTAYGSGGGGRVALVTPGTLQGGLATAPWDIIDTKGGTFSLLSGGAGTIWLEGLGKSHLIIDNKSQSGTQTDSTPLPASGTGALNAAGSDVTPAVASEFWLGLSFVGEKLIVNPDSGTPTLADDTVYTVSAVAGSNFTLQPAPTGLTGASHAWCVYREVDSLDIRGNAQFNFDGCLRVKSGNIASTSTTLAINGGLQVDTLELQTTSLAFTGNTGRLDLRRQVSNGVAPYRFPISVEGALTASVRPLVTGNLISVTTSTLSASNIDVQGAMTWSGTVSTSTAVVSGAATLTGTLDLDGLGTGFSADILTVTGASSLVRHTAHSANFTDRREVTLTGRVVEFLDGATINVQGRGFPGAPTGYAPASNLAADFNEGGSHIGHGSGPSLSAVAPSFDNLYMPSLAGGGGGSNGGTGGGVVHVVATERIKVGVVNAQGNAGASTPGGAGGSIYLNAPRVEVEGLLNARGGDGNASHGGGGGGGVSIIGNELAGALGAGERASMVDLRGGSSGYGAAGSGTLYVQLGAFPGDLLVDNRNQTSTTTDSTTLPFRFYGVPTAATATSLTLPASATPASAPVGYRINPDITQLTPALTDDTTYGITGLSGTIVTLDGDPRAQWATGDTSCAYYRFRHVDIKGRAQLRVVGCLRIDQGNFGTDGSTYVIDGGLNVNYVDFASTQTLQVQGTQGRFDAGTQVGGGVVGSPFDLILSGTINSGGIVAGDVTASNTSITLSGPLSVQGDLNLTGGSLSSTSSITTTGSLALNNTTLTAGQVNASGAVTLSGGTSLVDGITATNDIIIENGHDLDVRGLAAGLVSTAGSVIFRGAGTTGSHLVHTASFDGLQRELSITAAVDALVHQGAVLDVSVRGYQPGYAPASGLQASSSSGGSHAGFGGGASRGKTYDLVFDPKFAGGGSGTSGGGATGGGVILISAGRDVTLETAYANGATPSSGGGGAGGSINATAGRDLLLGVAQARGGNGSSASYHGGGGGYIALKAPNLLGPLAETTYNAAMDAALDARGGVAGSVAAGAGFVYLKSIRFENGVLIVDNENGASFRDSTPLRGASGIISSANATSITVASTSAFTDWTPKGLFLTVDIGEGNDGLADNTLFEITDRSGAVLTLSGNPQPVTTAAGASGQWAFAYVLDHLEVSGNAQLDATNALVRVVDGSLSVGSDSVFAVDGAIADTGTEGTLGTGLFLDVDTSTELRMSGTSSRFDVPYQVANAIISPVWSKVDISSNLELDRLKVQQIETQDINGTLSDVLTLETVQAMTLDTAVELTGFGAGLVAGTTLTLGTGSSVTHQVHAASSENRVARMSADTVVVTTTASVNVDFKGYTGGVAPTGVTAATGSIGGSHCGRGFNAPQTNYFDDIFAPSFAGGGAGTGGAVGGGAIRIAATTLADIDGTLSATGGTASGYGAGGGAVYISGDNIDVSGFIDALGGAGTASAGGGGCIAFVADVGVTGAIATTNPMAQVRAHGGFGNSSIAGGAGLIYIRDNELDDGTLIAWNNNHTGTQEDSTSLTSLPVGTLTSATNNMLTTSGVTLTGLRPSSRRQIRVVDPNATARLDDEIVRNVTSTAANTINLDGTASPFLGLNYASYYRFDFLEVSGNAHLVTSAHLRIDESSLSKLVSNDFTLTGGLSAPVIDFGPVTDLIISGNTSRFDVPADIASNVLDPTWDATLSGTIRLPSLKTLSISASNLNIRDLTRLEVVGSLSFTNTTCVNCMTIDASVDLAWSGGTFDIRALRAGRDLTLSNNTSAASLTLHGLSESLPVGFVDGIIAGEDLVVGPGVVITHQNSPSVVGESSVRRAHLKGHTFDLDAQAQINVSGKGWPGGPSNGTPGTALKSGMRAGNNYGGSHGGAGAGPSLSSLAPTFDAYWAPSLPGGGGGFSGGAGGAGGGVVRIDAATTAIVNGTINASGQSQGSGGAGGSVHVTAGGELIADGTIDVRGGAPTSSGGAGGGGMISLVAQSMTGNLVGASPWTNFKVSGGSASTAGGAGTLYIRSASTDTYGHLITDNSGLNTVAQSTRLPFSTSGTWSSSSFSAATAKTTMGRATAFDTNYSPVGYTINPKTLQGGPTLSDDSVNVIDSVSGTSVVVNGDTTALATTGAAHIAHYRFDTLTVTGNAQLVGDAEVFVRDGHWQDDTSNFYVTGAVELTRLDLNTVTNLQVLGTRGGWNIGSLVANNSNTPRFNVALSGTVALNSLRSFGFTSTNLNLTLNGLLDVSGHLGLTTSTITLASPTSDMTVTGDLTLAGSTISAPNGTALDRNVITVGGNLTMSLSGHPSSAINGTTTGTDVIVTGAANFTDTTVTLRQLTADSASFADTTTPANNPINAVTLTIAKALSLTGTNLIATNVNAGTMSVSGGTIDVDNVTVNGNLLSTNSGSFVSTNIAVNGVNSDASFDGANASIAFVDLDVGRNLTFSGGADFVIDGTLTNGIDAGGLVWMTGAGTTGTHVIHPASDGSRKGLRISAREILIAETASIDVNGKGYPATGGGSFAPSSVLKASAAKGGSHIGLTYGDTVSNRMSYDNIYAPEWAGVSGGATGYSWDYSCYRCYYGCYWTTCTDSATLTGTAGGGVVKLSASLEVVVRGTVLANGNDSTNSAGGAGGSITLSAPYVTVTGMLEVSGGNAGYHGTNRGDFNSDPGGGGAISVIADEVNGKLASLTPWTAVDLRGGVGTRRSVTTYAGAGTFYLQAAQRRTLIVDAGGQTPQAQSTLLPFGATSSIATVDVLNKAFVSSSSTFPKWAPVGYFVNPDISQGDTTMTDDDVYQVTAADIALQKLTLGFAATENPSEILVANRSYAARYDFETLEVRGGAQLGVIGQVMVWEGSVTDPGTANTTTVGSPGLMAHSGAISISGSFEVDKPELLAFVTQRSDIPGNNMLAFVNGVLGTTYVDPVVAADAICQAEALAAGLSGRYLAWLGSPTSNPVSRFPYNGIWSVRGSASALGASRNAIIDGNIAEPITRDARGVTLGSDASFVWTGTSALGVSSGSTCGNWDSAGNATYGEFTMSDSNWTNAGLTSCAQTGRLYCLQRW